MHGILSWYKFEGISGLFQGLAILELLVNIISDHYFMTAHFPLIQLGHCSVDSNWDLPRPIYLQYSLGTTVFAFQPPKWSQEELEDDVCTFDNHQL